MNEAWAGLAAHVRKLLRIGFKITITNFFILAARPIQCDESRKQRVLYLLKGADPDHLCPARKVTAATLSSSLLKWAAAGVKP